MPADYDIKIYQGDTWTLQLYLTGDYSSATHKFTLQANLGAASNALQLTLGSGITAVYDAVAQKTLVTITMSSANSESLNPDTIYAYDYETTLSGVVLTWLSGSFTLTEDVS